MFKVEFILPEPRYIHGSPRCRPGSFPSARRRPTFRFPTTMISAHAQYMLASLKSQILIFALRPSARQRRALAESPVSLPTTAASAAALRAALAGAATASYVLGDRATAASEESTAFSPPAMTAPLPALPHASLTTVSCLRRNGWCWWWR